MHSGVMRILTYNTIKLHRTDKEQELNGYYVIHFTNYFKAWELYSFTVDEINVDTFSCEQKLMTKGD